MSRNDNKMNLNTASGIGLQMAVAFGLFTYGGYLADQKLNSKPWLMLAGVGLAFVYAGYEIFKLLLQIKDNDSGNDNKED